MFAFKPYLTGRVLQPPKVFLTLFSRPFRSFQEKKNTEQKQQQQQQQQQHTHTPHTKRRRVIVQNRYTGECATHVIINK